jgi:pimeloyl-ACP methyl ester carboxylesterase
MIHKIVEQAVLIGKEQSLVGIMTRAVMAEPNGKPTVIILNTGIVHRVGHHRMFVTLSRALAGIGFNVLRFDFSGIGDSEARTDSLPPLDSALADLKEVLDWLGRERSVSRVVLVGLCSGADHAILFSHKDPRVAALVLMDPSIPTTVRFYARYILQHLTRMRSFINVALGRSGLLKLWMGHVFFGVRSSANVRPDSLVGLRFHKYLKESYRRAIANGVQILAVFTGDLTRQAYREQMLEALPDVIFGSQLKLEFLSSSDHLFTSEKDRVWLIDIILDWIILTDSHPEARAAAAHKPGPQISAVG